MTDFLREVEKYFEEEFQRKKLRIYDFNSFEFCDLKLIKDIEGKLIKEGTTFDGLFVSQLAMLYLYLTKSLHLDLNMIKILKERV